MRTSSGLRILGLAILSLLVVAARPGETARRPLEGTVDDLLDRQPRPFAIGHRGSGENLGEDPSRPIENTVRSVRHAFLAGLSVVEVDVQRTKDGELAVFHDDYLPDLTCLNTLTLADLQARLPHVPTLEAVLQKARRLNQEAGDLRGLVIVEMKPAAPICDPDDTQDELIVSAVVASVREKGMARQVLLTSFSPALIFHARLQAPEIARILGVNSLQFLTAEQIEQLGISVTLIDKPLALGLQWAEIGGVLRLPGYRSLGEFLRTVRVVGALAVEADIVLLGHGGARLVDRLHGLGLLVLGFTVDDAAQWDLLESLGVDGIYTDDVQLGVDRQPGALAR